MGGRRWHLSRWTLPESRRLSVWIFSTSFFIAITLSEIQGKLIFTNRLHEARIYHGAPPGLYVTTVRARHNTIINVTDGEVGDEAGLTSQHNIIYKLLRGGGEFQVDKTSGRVTTLKKVTKAVEESYSVLVVAISGGETESLHEQVRVTRYNRFTPSFTLSAYYLEIPQNKLVGMHLMKVTAKDDDKDSYNAEVYYYLRPKWRMEGDADPHLKTNNTIQEYSEDDSDEDAAKPGTNMWLNDYSRYFLIDPRSGIISLRRSITAKVPRFVFDIVAIDGGSPHRWNVTTLEIAVKNITEPLEVNANNVTETTARVCWKVPLHGIIKGYLVRYKEVWRAESRSYNETSPFLHEDVLNITVEHHAIQHCADLGNLHPDSTFELRAYGWNINEMGLGSDVFFLSTAKPKCPIDNVCGDNGKCHILNNFNRSATPNYRCECDAGFYGIHCENVDSCSSSPCRNLGKCTNVSSYGEYKCECVDGFYGSDCSSFDPCASVDVAACHNGGICRSSSSHMYNCMCRDGFFGRSCDRFDPCNAVSTPCLNGAVCHNISDSVVSCACIPGYKGKRCEENVDECASSPCLNGGTCKDGIHSFSCSCASGFKGALCQEEVNECESSPCLNHGTCVDGVNAFECDCPLGYEGNRCEVDIDDCLPSPCFNGAICRDGPNSFTCLCASGYEGVLCNNSIMCSPELLNLAKGDLYFNSTSHGDIVNVPCPFGPYGAFALRRCVLTDNGTVHWMAPIMSFCRNEGFQMAESLAGGLKLLTSDPSILNALTLSEVTDKLEIVLEYALKDNKIAKDMVHVFSNVLDANETAFTARKGNSTAARLSNVLERFVNEVDMSSQNMVIEGNNLRIAVSMLNLSDQHGVPKSSFQLKGMSPKLTWDMDLLQKKKAKSDYINGTYLSNNADDAVIHLSPEIVRLAPEARDMRLQFLAYRNAKFFKENSEVPFDRYTPADHPVFSLSVANVTVRNMSEAVKFTVKKIMHGTWTCVFWDETRMGRWSKQGLSIQQNEDEITCSSSHMTAFSVLLDPDPQPSDAIHQMSLSMISYVGSGLSIFGLSLTIITYSLFRSLNRDKPGKILLNLCISMLLMNVAFLAGSMETKVGQSQDILNFGSATRMEESSTLCRMVAAFTHYLLLTTLSWMTVEAANMYQLLIHVFATSETKFMLKRCIIAWGLPLVIVGTTASMSMTYYDARNEYCMLSPAHPYVYYATYVGPSCLLIFINVIVFFFVTRVLFQPRGMPAQIQHKPPSRYYVTITFAQVRGSFTVMILLGITWVFGALAIGPARVLFQYVFCVLNSLQGFLLFIVRCLQYPEARSAWYVLLKTGTLKKHRGKKVTTSTCSHVKLSLSGSSNVYSSAISRTHLCDGHTNSNLSTNTTSDGTTSTFAMTGGAVANHSGIAFAPSWVYGGRLPQTAALDESTRVVAGDDLSIIKNRSPRHLPSNRGIASCSAMESLDMKEGRDTHWQYLNLNRKYIGNPNQHICMSKMDTVELSADDTYDVPFMVDNVENEAAMQDDQICENMPINKCDNCLRKPRHSSQCDQGYSSAEQSPTSRRVTAGVLAKGNGLVDALTTL